MEENKSKTIKYIQEINKIFTDLKNLVKEEDKIDIENYIIKFNRLEQERERGLYFITIQGSLKTGKSTLTNLFLGKDVAITKAGSDTTKTSYIITKANDEKSKIIIYKLNDSVNTDDDEKVLESIIDDIKGLELENRYSKNYSKTTEPYDKKTIEKYTVNESGGNDLFINIQLAKESTIFNSTGKWILDNDIAILDTPGVEGEKANNPTTVKVIEEVHRRTNMLIVMQSTITPINQIEIDELKIYDNNNVSSIRLIHNKFDLKHWADEDDKKKLRDNEEQAKTNAKVKLKDQFHKNVPLESLNLAKISDFLQKQETYKDNKSMEEEKDNFFQLIDNLNKSINDKRQRDKEEKATKDIKDLINNLTKENGYLSILKSKYNDKFKTIEKEKDKIVQEFESHKSDIQEMVEKAINFNDIETIINNVINKNKLTITGIEHFDAVKYSRFKMNFEKSLNEESLKTEISKQIDNYFEALNNKIRVQLIKTINNHFEDRKNVIEDMKQLLRKDEISMYNKVDCIEIDIDKIPEIENTIEIFNIMKESVEIIESGRKFIFNDYQLNKETLKKNFQEKIQGLFLEQWKEEKHKILTDELKSISKKHNDNIDDIKKEYEEKFDKNNKETLESHKNITISINNATAKLKDYERSL
jgi:GTPase Era involved in 16S rRNA processing